MKKAIVYVLALVLCTLQTFSQVNNSLTGTWLVQDGSAKIKIEKSGEKFSGKIVWLNPATDKNGKPLLDSKNPDKALQSRPQMGLPLLKDFVYDSDNLWNDGTIYDPESGKTYSCKIEMMNKNEIEVRGYIGISMFGRTETWKRCDNITMK